MRKQYDNQFTKQQNMLSHEYLKNTTDLKHKL